MKRIKTLLFSFLAISFVASAQYSPAQTADDTASIWKKSKSFGLGFVFSDMNVDGVKENSNYGFAMNLSNTYFLNKEPLWGMVKFGIDAVWFDINYVNYKSGTGINLSIDDFDDFDDYYDYMEEEDILDLGIHKLDIGIGVGPSAHVAPFTHFDNDLRLLRASLYLHFTPSFSALLMSENNETKAAYGFSPVINFGGIIQWKMIGLGVEGRWCTANFNNVFVDEEIGGPSKLNCKTSDCRLFLRLCF